MSNQTLGKLKVGIVAAVAVVGLGAGHASAATVSFDVYQNPTAADTSAFAPGVTITDNGDSITFDFTYDGPGSLRAVAFETGVADLFEANNAGVGNVVSSNGNSGLWFGRSSGFDLWNGDSISWQGESMAVVSSNAALGVDQLGEKLTITLNKVNDSTGVNDVLAMLGTMGSRMGLMVESFQNGVSIGAISGGSGDVFTGISAPTPAAFATGLMLMGGLGLRRTRRA